ncbi:hypothetical protein [Streptomyces sp. NBC_00343]|uniref:hypothetical protein n=1 Tax=Streptomyces sp. NBC_00343 TaxID=2975719 RepID=UPI002E289314|nr:hypothetical protein [Streptomyces sp. NBC_00343]
MSEEDDRYTLAEAAIERELTEAQLMDFNSYVDFMAHYGARLHELSRMYDDPETAYRHLLKYSDDFVEDFNGE